MDEADFREYVDRFNDRDYEGFGAFYAEDVVFELGDRQRLEGRDAILSFYREVHERIEESLEVERIIVGDDGLAAELRTEFLAVEDWEEFVGGPMEEGDSVEFVSFVHYHVDDGQFTHVKSARFKEL